MPFQVEQADERIIVRGELRRFDQLRVLKAALFDAVERRELREIALDFAECGDADQAAMLPLLPVVVGYRESVGAAFSLVEPNDDALKRRFSEANWAHFIDPERHPLSLPNAERSPAQRFGAADEIEPIVAGVVDFVGSQTDAAREALAALEWTLYELLDNVVSHANDHAPTSDQPPAGGFVQAALDEQTGRVELVVADGGAGIAQRLRVRRHEQALARAVRGGGGLQGAFRIAELSAGQFEINSGFGLLHASRRGPDAYRTDKRRIRYDGTAVRCELRVDDPTLLARALELPPRPHAPLPPAESNAPSVPLQAIGSRAAGRSVREQIEQRLREDGRAALDFGGIPIISSGFADEALGQLFAALGPRAFMTRIELRNANATIESLIDRAILRRASGDSERAGLSA